MVIELKKATFRRLVLLYLATVLLCTIGTFIEADRTRWADFSSGFEQLRGAHFGRIEDLSDSALFATAALCLVTIGGHLVSILGLIGFRRWARPLFWTTMLLNALYVFVPGFFPYWSSFFMSVGTFISAALFGMILLLVYSCGYGDTWFARDSTDQEIV